MKIINPLGRCPTWKSTCVQVSRIVSLQIHIFDGRTVTTLGRRRKDKTSRLFILKKNKISYLSILLPQNLILLQKTFLNHFWSKVFLQNLFWMKKRLESGGDKFGRAKRTPLNLTIYILDG